MNLCTVASSIPGTWLSSELAACEKRSLYTVQCARSYVLHPQTPQPHTCLPRLLSFWRQGRLGLCLSCCRAQRLCSTSDVWGTLRWCRAGWKRRGPQKPGRWVQAPCVVGVAPLLKLCVLHCKLIPLAHQCSEINADGLQQARAAQKLFISGHRFGESMTACCL